MSSKKTNTRSKAKSKASKKDEEPGVVLEWVRWAGDWFRYGLSIAFTEHTWRLISAVLLVGVVTAWAVARGPLMERVASDRTDPVRVSFEWPVDSSGNEWLPGSVRVEMERIAHASLTMDPFDRDALEQVASDLERTGWLARVDSVRREPEGIVRIEGAWRAHAAVVEKRGARYLVGMEGEVLLAPTGGMDISRMYTISEPRAEAPTTRDGSLAYGVSWLGGVDDAIALLRAVDGMDGSVRISGVDLSRFAETQHLVLVTEGGSRIVWGSPLGSGVPGEASVEQKTENLRRILANGDDLRHRSIEIVLPRVEIDERAGR